jgi:hypothetical protein
MESLFGSKAATSTGLPRPAKLRTLPPALPATQEAHPGSVGASTLVCGSGGFAADRADVTNVIFRSRR